MAPESKKATDEKPYDAKQADIFSVGLVIYYLCTGLEAWKG